MHWTVKKKLFQYQCETTRDQLGKFSTFTVLYKMPISKGSACHKYRVFANHTSYLYNIYQTWKRYDYQLKILFRMHPCHLVLAHSERFPNVRVSLSFATSCAAHSDQVLDKGVTG